MYLPNVTFRIESIRAERYNFDPIQQLGIGIRIMFGKPEKSSDNAFRVGFVIKLDCSPPIASIDVKGTAFITPTDPREWENISKELEQGKIPYPLMTATFSYVLPIVSLLTRELGLPPPIPPPPPPMKSESRKIDYHL